MDRNQLHKRYRTQVRDMVTELEAAGFEIPGPVKALLKASRRGGLGAQYADLRTALGELAESAPAELQRKVDEVKRTLRMWGSADRRSFSPTREDLREESPTP